MRNSTLVILLLATIPSPIWATTTTGGNAMGNVASANLKLHNASAFPTKLKNNIQAGANQFMTDSCNLGGNSLPTLKEGVGDVEINIYYSDTRGPNDVCGVAIALSREITFYKEVMLDGYIRNCYTKKGIARDTVAHEIGHVLGLGHPTLGCNGKRIMGPRSGAFTPTGVFFWKGDRTPQSDECGKLREILDPPDPNPGLTGPETEPENTDPNGVFDPCAFLGPACGSPIAFDLNGDGSIPTSGTKDLVLFDLDGDGQLELITWSSATWPEPFLALDLNNDGVINSGRELFGDAAEHPYDDALTPLNGYHALAWYDTPALGGNGDGVISKNDAVWKSLLLWTDRDHNGISARSELLPLYVSTIKGIGIAHWFDTHIDRNGNGHFFKSLFSRSLNGQIIEAETHDLYFLIKRK